MFSRRCTLLLRSSSRIRRNVGAENDTSLFRSARSIMLRTSAYRCLGTQASNNNTIVQTSPFPLAVAVATVLCLTAVGSGLVMDTSDGIIRTQNDKGTSSIEITEKLSKEDDESDDDETTTTTILNWSGTHEVIVGNSDYYEPESIAELEAIVRECHRKSKPIRPLGSALSPNGIGFHAGGMISLSNLDRIVKVDKDNMTVTVEAGARVSQVIDALRLHGLTLPNLASIAEQQMGGFVQVGAHGTGAKIAPVDDFVTSLTLVTPTRGKVTLTPASNDFSIAKVGLGSLGVVAEITMKCILAHNLVEHTYVLTRAQAKQQLNGLLKKHKHIRYMWIPYTDAVIVVTNDPETGKEVIPPPKYDSTEERMRPLTDLLGELTMDSPEPQDQESMIGMGFGELRDALLAINPLDVEHVKVCNRAEAEFWRRSQGYQIKPSDQLLQFDCGGQQWVWEVCFPTGTLEENNGNDMKFMEDLLAKIEERGIAAHSPIEQRWTKSSTSLMSPAYGPADGLHSWVGIIMYLPSEDPNQREEITAKFKRAYCVLMRAVGAPMNAVSHWAKLEQPSTPDELKELKEFMERRYPVAVFNAARAKYDSKNLMANDLINEVLGRPEFRNNNDH